MRIAVLGDIHANVAALEAVLAEVAKAGVDRVLHTGDLVGWGPRPNETIGLIKARRIEGVRGNHDEAAAWADDAAAAAGNGSPSRDTAEATLRWTVRRLGFSERQVLTDLPFSIQETVGDRRLTLFHASPIDLHQPIREDASETWLDELAGETGADVHLFGHTHKPFHREVNGRHFINAGSVGLPQDGDPRACLAIVELNRSVSVEYRRIAYDVEKTAREVEASGLAPDVARALRTGT